MNIWKVSLIQLITKLKRKERKFYSNGITENKNTQK